MSMLAMAAPSPHSTFAKRDFPWDGFRASDFPSRPRTEPEKIALPSIRQAFPELHLRIQPQDVSARCGSSTTSPTTGYSGVMTPPEYTHSPNLNHKRRRLSEDDDAEVERASQIPRHYAHTTSVVGSQPTQLASPTRSVTDSWSTRTSPFLPSGPMPAIRSPVATMEVSERPMERRPTLPSLPMLSFERDSLPLPRTRDHAALDEYQTPRQPGGHPVGPMMEPAPSHFRLSPYTYSYAQATRSQSLSVGPAHHSFERSASYATPTYSSSYPDFVRYGEFGSVGVNGDNKQRKRRGNLPKETTDKLRAWFVAHLHHPYPTEEEKQELMRQTGLQMNQISNWFINARRRQLPALINNARLESDMISSRAAAAAGVAASAATPTTPQEQKIFPTTERPDFEEKGASVPLSDGEGSSYDEDVRRASQVKRGSV